ncbi:hypothetical protein FJK98_00825 [Micromonospora sp. HM134]|nr:hypothetical protein FJK98_00825 [Micromonospora sp. HM134]
MSADASYGILPTVDSAVRRTHGRQRPAWPRAVSKERSPCPSLPPRLTRRCWTGPRPAGTRTPRST